MKIRVWEYPNKQVVPFRDNVVFAGLGQGNIACKLVRCVKYWATGAFKRIDFPRGLEYNCFVEL